MRVFKAPIRFGSIAVVAMAVLIMGGCATAIKHSYDAGISFTGLKSYAWEPSSALYSRDSLLETNVRFFADQVLEKKGFSKNPEKPDLLITMSYEYEIGNYQYDYQLRMLSVNVYEFQNKELIWRGTASGAINTDASSDDLKDAVQGILSHFPPK
jgi:hypothetical protein